MNIFVINHTPESAAEDHCDTHVRKMLVESAQMLSFAHHAAGSRMAGMLYRNSKSHQNHPCTKWVKESRANYIWLYELALCLDYQFNQRSGKPHKTGEEILPLLDVVPPGYTKTFLTPFAQAIPEQFRSSNVVESYRDFYATKYFIADEYKQAPMPEWLANRLYDFGKRRED